MKGAEEDRAKGVMGEVRILLLDDNPDDRALVVRSLRKEIENPEIIEILDSKGFSQALERLEEFDLVITDYQLRWIDGLQVLREVKNRVPDTPVIMFTATGSEEIAVEAMKNGLDDYILKSPKHFARLAATVAQTLRRKREMEEVRGALSLAQKEWEAIFHAVGQPVFVLDDNFTVLEVNKVTEKITGASREELIGKKCCSFMHFTDSPPPSCPLKSLKDLGAGMKEGDVFEGEMYVEALDRTFWVTCSPVIGPEGSPIKYIHVATDITARKRLENRLKELNERLTTLINATPYFIIFKDGEGRWLEANESALRIFQLDKRNYQGKRDTELAEFTDPIYRDAFLVCERTNEDAWERGGISRSEEIIPDPYGTPRIYDVIKVPLFHDNGRRKGLVVIGRDITEFKRAGQEREGALARMSHSQKMEALGTLAGGIAHEFNNILTAVQGYIELAMLEMSREEEEALDYLARSQEACERAANLVKQMLYFTRKRQVKKETVDVNSLVERMASLLDRVLGEDILVRVELESGLWEVEADKGSIEQIIMNLALNARDAMPQGGTLTFITENVELREKECKGIAGVVPGKYVKLVISDTGEGIDRHLIDKIFDLFFTTKEVGKGTGLGLSVVYGMIKTHGGGVRVLSELNKGTSFEVYLPAKTQVDTESGELSGIAKKGERILLVEDEDMVLKMMEKALTAKGYEVISAKSYKEAFEKVDKGVDVSSAIVDLVLSDGSGIDLGKELLKRNPDVKLMVVSGYAPPEDKMKWLRSEKIPFLRKPFRMEELIKTLKSLRGNKG